MNYEWDENKNKLNKLNHGISFEDAKSVFDDENAISWYDELHSQDEDRFIIVGIGIKYREMTVCHCFREDDVIRIISARKATNSEIQLYWRSHNES